MKQYISRIRNLEKRRYAQDYANFITGGGTEPDTSQYQLSEMGAQAVRMQLAEISKKGQ